MNRVIAISDIHGCFDPFYELVTNRIGLDKTDRLILLGDYIDRGEKSKEVIDFIMDLIKSEFNVTTLAGNHETMLIDSYNSPGNLPLWYLNHGITTLQSFNLSDIRDIDGRYLRFFLNLRYYEFIGDMIFVHAGLNDFLSDPFSDRYSMIWESRQSYLNPRLREMTIIHGHRPKTIGYVESLLERGSKVIPIDTGCVYNRGPEYGYLSALDVTSMKLISVQNKREMSQ